MIRRLVQSLSLVGVNLNVLYEVKQVCVPVLNCHSCPLASFSCPIGILGHFTDWRVFPFLALGAVGAAAAFLGRAFCGWACPFGYLQDGLYKIRTRKFRLPAWAYKVKYGVLIITVFAVPALLTVDSPLFFCQWCPAATLESTVPYAFLRGGFPGVQVGRLLLPTGGTAARLGALGLIVGLVIYSERAFCLSLCPLGALLAPFNKVSALQMERRSDVCTDCGACGAVCPAWTPAQAKSGLLPGDSSMECMFCMKCTDECRVPGALGTTFLGFGRRVPSPPPTAPAGEAEPAERNRETAQAS